MHIEHESEAMLEEKLIKPAKKGIIDKSLIAKMKEKGSKTPEASLDYDRTEQVEFDFNKLGGKPSETENTSKTTT